MFIDVLKDTVIDTVKLLPFLFLTYLAMEYLEHKTGEKSKHMLKGAGKLGPVAGGLIGAFPQCGFSAAASSLYSGGVITMGTLLAVFLSTSDEMLPIFISEAVPVSMILKILGIKVVLGIVTGLLIDLGLKFVLGKQQEIEEKHHHHKEHHEKDIHDLCEHEHCHCEEGSILKSALLHTVQITLFIFLISFVIGFAVELVGQEQIAAVLANRPIVGVFLAGIVGLIPNCAASVVITQLYLAGVLGLGQMMAGLLVGAGVGILVLCRTNKNAKENLSIIALLYGTGVIWGILIELTGIAL
ncbi:MAG: putative manganese transporter [Lachnospiraceae bacterium]|nr:putative manganese transporter [Lachnospiraceae bacterium]